MTIAVDLGRKATKQTNKQTNEQLSQSQKGQTEFRSEGVSLNNLKHNIGSFRNREYLESMKTTASVLLFPLQILHLQMQLIESLIVKSNIVIMYYYCTSAIQK